MKVVKHSGDIVDFNPTELKQSLLKSGASQVVVETILQTINKEIYEGISTKQIYKMAFGLLKKASNSNAARYNLKEAIRLLGPAGFFFEKYIARLFASEHYETKTNLTLQGKCVSHEIDVLIKKDQIISMVECKFHIGKDANSEIIIFAFCRSLNFSSEITPVRCSFTIANVSSTSSAVLAMASLISFRWISGICTAVFTPEANSFNIPKTSLNPSTSAGITLIFKVFMLRSS